MSVRYPITYLKRFRESLVITPSVTMYNIANMGNFGSYGDLADTTVDSATLNSGTYLNGPNNQAAPQSHPHAARLGQWNVRPGRVPLHGVHLKVEF